MTIEDVKRIERAMQQFNTCDSAGRTITIEVDSKLDTKSFLGWCSHEGRKIDVEPTCRICLRHKKRKNEKPSKKTGTTRARIRRGRERQKGREEDRKKFRRPGLGFFDDPTNSL